MELLKHETDGIYEYHGPLKGCLVLLGDADSKNVTGFRINELSVVSRPL